jgi:Spx/MgsR family transcriptional regulator
MPPVDAAGSPSGASSGPVIYGIANCDQVRKARAWLTSAGIAYRFHDYRLAGLESERLSIWLQRVPWDALLNRRGTTWRKLDERERLAVTDQLSAQALMLAEPRLIKRPVLEWDDRILLGFSEALYEAFFAAHRGDSPLR